MKLTKPQEALLRKAATAPFKPYHGEWSTFYKLAKRGLMKYTPDRDFQEITITDEGRSAIGAAK